MYMQATLFHDTHKIRKIYVKFVINTAAIGRIDDFVMFHCCS